MESEQALLVKPRYLSLRREGGSLVLAVGSFVPKSWRMVKVSASAASGEDEDEWLELKIEKVA